MSVSVREFVPRRALAALMYLVRGATNDLYILMKMLYAADKMHLRKAGRFIAGDDYIAMENGATPSGAYDLIKFVRGDHGVHRGLPEVGQFFRVENRTRLVLTADVPEGDLSEIARECLDEVIKLHCLHPSWIFWWREAHDAAWRQSVSENDPSPSMTIESVARGTQDNQSLLDYLSDPYPEAAEG